MIRFLSVKNILRSGIYLNLKKMLKGFFTESIPEKCYDISIQ